MKKVIVLSLLVICGILFAAQIKRGTVSLLLLADVVRPPAQAVMGKLISGPAVRPVMVSSRGRMIPADLYHPGTGGRHFPLLLVHGVHPSGKDHEQLVILAGNLARAGFLVLVPDFEGMKNLRLRITDAEDVLQCFLTLINYPESVGRGGMLGISYGSGPMLLAAADARIRDQVSVVATFGGYFDLRSVLRFIMTGVYEYGGHRGFVRPDVSLRWMFMYHNSDLLHSTDDRGTLRNIIEHRNRYDNVAAAALSKNLGPEGKSVYLFLMNSDPERFQPLYENLPLQVRERIYQLSPERAVKYLSASFIIAHGTDDYSIPYTESLRLADSVHHAKRVHLALLPQFMHVEPIEPSWGGRLNRFVVGGWRLFAAIYTLFEQCEQAAASAGR